MIADHIHTNLGNSDIDDRSCLFCHLEPERVFAANEHALAIYGGFPVNPGHVLIIPKRHIVSTFEATEEERVVNLDLPG